MTEQTFGTGMDPPQRRSSADHLLELALEVVDLVPQLGRVLEAELGGRLVHLLLEGPDEPGEFVPRQLGQGAPDAVPPAAGGGPGRVSGRPPRPGARRGCRSPPCGWSGGRSRGRGCTAAGGPAGGGSRR